jgi:hypothetical protein
MTTILLLLFVKLFNTSEKKDKILLFIETIFQYLSISAPLKIFARGWTLQYIPLE